MSKICKLSDLKVGDRFTVEGKVVQKLASGGVDFILNGARYQNFNCSPDRVKVIKLDPPPRELVKGERIRAKKTGHEGEYIGRGWGWFDHFEPTRLSHPANTEFYDVI